MPAGKSESTVAVIIGAGPAGLAVGACLRRAGISLVQIERAGSLAPAWRQHYDRLHLHTPKHTSALPYMPFPKDYPRYLSRDQLIAYLEAYAERFTLEPHCGEEALSVERHDGVWLTTSNRAHYQSEVVIVASGVHAMPNLPAWEGMASFQGKVLHSSEYRNGEPFRDQDVLVVGLGNSGGEIAIDLWEHGARPALSVRSPVNIIPRDLFGFPTTDIASWTNALPSAVVDMVFTPVLRLLGGDVKQYGLARPPYGAATQVKKTGRIPLIDVGTMRLIKQGHVKVHPDLERFTTQGIVFKNGTEQAFDAVVLATGYRAALEFLRIPEAEEWRRDRMTIPRNGQAGAPGLYFCGFYSAVTGTLHQISVEAQNIARNVASQCESCVAQG